MQLTDGQWKRIFWIPIIITFFLALIDIKGIPLWNQGVLTSLFASIFFNFIFLIIATSTVIFYLITKDKSEAIAFGLAFLIQVYFGLWDLIFVKIHPLSDLSHLNNHFIIGKFAMLMGSDMVTMQTLLISSIVGLILSWFVIKWLRRI